MMETTFSDECGYMTAPASVASSCNKDMCFYYSAPTSPSSRIKLSALNGYQTGFTTPRTTHDEDNANSNLDEFEFETSRRFNIEELDNSEPCYNHDQMQEQQQEGPTMAFADELFSEGKVLPLMPPLKLPPRMLQNGDGSMVSAQSSTLTSPRSPGFAIRLPFLRHSLWNDDFDPFMVALEKVKEEKRGNSKAKSYNNNNGLRRTRSLSPFRGFNNHRSEKHVKQDELHCCGSSKVIFELQREPLLKQSSRKSDMLSGSKGLAFTTFEPKKTSTFKPSMETKKEESEKGGFFWTRKKKKENIVKFFFGNSFMGKSSSQHKLGDEKPALEKQELMRKVDMKSVNSAQSTKWGKDETKGDMNKMNLVCHKPRAPRILLCLGHHGGYVK